MSRAGILAVMLALTGVGLLAVGVSAQTPSPPVPSAQVLSQPAIEVPVPPTDTAAPSGGSVSSGAQSPAGGVEPNTGAAPSAAAAAPSTQPVVGPILPASKPTVLQIPRLEVDRPLMELGINPDHTVQVPPLSEVKTPGWLRESPTPGQLGPSVILGHVDSYRDKGVFYRLGELRPGDTVNVTRVDSTVAVFIVTKIRQYPKDAFPVDEVYDDIDHAGLRLITCGGSFDERTRSYRDNIVVYAQLQSSHPAAP